MKYLPNLLTGLRLVLCVPLFMVKPFSGEFFILYTISGISDMLDGPIARKTGNVTQWGATFDSIADAALVFTVLVRLVPVLSAPAWMLLWIVLIAVLRILSLAVGFYRYRALSFLHTYANKATGLLLFCFPYFYHVVGITVTGIFLCTVAVLSAAEELWITCTAKQLNRNDKGIFWH